MMITRTVLTSMVLAGCLTITNHAQAQTVQRVQPIVLEASSSTTCCQSPATAACAQVPLPCGDCTYLAPRDRDPLRVIPTSTQLKPLPVGTNYRGYPAASASVTGYPETVTTLSPPTTSVQVLRPIVTTPPAPTVPEGYVVGKGLIGQPKLYKPGQPVRNMLRFITL